LIELLVVVLILAILMAVALPLYLSAVADSQKKTCRANMQTIANAVQAARVKNVSANYNSFAGAVSTTLEPDLQSVPICPNGGTYSVITTGTCNDANGNSVTIPANSFGVTCTFSTHGGFIPGAMSN
ncbi:MAG TPA: type II secretion system protein, partial [Chthonomonadaceae bacterium]|nr:type II secretion system protein [Chthonomonadaceae bacterium]